MKKRAASREGMVTSTIALDKDTHRRLALIAVDENTAIAELVREAVAQWLDRRERTQKRRRP
jgi:predicted transcriptional regulator